MYEDYERRIACTKEQLTEICSLENMLFSEEKLLFRITGFYKQLQCLRGIKFPIPFKYISIIQLNHKHNIDWL